MLPDFVRVKRRRKRLFVELVKTTTSSREPLLGQLPSVRQHEGRDRITQTAEGHEHRTAYERLSSVLSLDLRDAANIDNTWLVEQARRMGEELASQQMRVVFQRLDECTKRAGTQIDSRGDPFNADLFIEALERITIDFGPDGQPYMPTFVTSPEQASKIRKKLDEWEKDPELKRRIGEIIERKRIEWRDREANRKLVD